MVPNELAELLETARFAAAEAGALAVKKWQQPMRLTQKGFRDWVTDADFAVQGLITSLIRERFPTHGFLAEEESSGLPDKGDVRWIIDPIDGTTNYSRQQPNFCISIAAVAGAVTQIGVILDPLRQELFSATRETPALLNDEPILVSDTGHLADAVLAFDWTHSRQARQATLDSLRNVGHEARSLRSIGSAALAIAWVAAGRLDAYWNWHLNAWDYAAGGLLVERAGGRCSTIGASQLTMTSGAGSCLASNGSLHSTLQRVLASEGGR